MSLNFEEFEVRHVPLQDTNLIEASAGTGKTYSIAILALRLIIENEIPIQKILLVTYTKNAVAELEIRLRSFVEKAWRHAQGKDSGDSTLSEVVNAAIKMKGPEKILDLLRNAFLFLDETAVLTIHSFCQQVLNEFAFETNQLFGATLTTDRKSIIKEEVQKFWRKNITTLPVEVLRELDISLSSIMGVVESHLSGKNYAGYDATFKYALPAQVMKDWRAEVTQNNLLIDGHYKSITDYIKTNAEKLEAAIAGNSYARKSFTGATADPKLFIQLAEDKLDKQYIAKIFPEIFPKFISIQDLGEANKKAANEFLSSLYKFAIQQISNGVKQYLQSHNQMSFDDLIQRVHTALVANDNPRLTELIRQKYAAVFVDEFQDTDALQYEIFEKAFGEQTILFYIGDPKQSIYSFRSADIFTYLKARNTVKHVYGMNTNYRSAKSYITGMNEFFNQGEDFDPFYFQGEENAINYIDVDSPQKKHIQALLENDKPVPALNIIEDANNGEVLASVAAMCSNLLSDKFMLQHEGSSRKVRPSDIGILVNSNKLASELRSALSAKQIPAVTVSEEKIFDSDEAAEILNLLAAMHDIKISNINRALLSGFTNYTSADIRKLNAEKLVELFSTYKEQWIANGVFVALNAFLTEFNVNAELLRSGTVAAERTYTNIQQLLEILYKKERFNQYSPADLIGSMQRLISEGEEGDEYLQRIEREEEAVRIVTVHKSKGLEYNIVLLPSLDYTLRKQDGIISYRDNELNQYLSVQKSEAGDRAKKLYEQQAEQEFRRLLYVAVTRGVYAGYVFSNTYKSKSSLKYFLTKLTKSDSIRLKEKSEIDYELKYKNESGTKIFSPERIKLEIAGNNWQRSSYSSLQSHLPVTAKERRYNFTEEYDTFIFRDLLPGARSGNIIHQVFEHVNFADYSYWSDTITNTLTEFDPAALETNLSQYLRLVEEVSKADFKTDDNTFQLSEISSSNRLHELEFNFIVKNFSPLLLSHKLNTEELQITVKEMGDIEGMLNGIIDMFFEHDGKYYILDWKSTYLGPHVNSYAQPALAAAMNENNYHLQYLIYTLAVKKYLNSRLKNFDYEKHFGGVFYVFVRGVRKGSSTGIYFNRPSLQRVETLEEIF